MDRPSFPGKRLVCLVLCLVSLVLMATPAMAAGVSTATVRPAAAVHYYAGKSSACIGYMEHGTQLTVLGERGEFYKIDCYDMKGYIARDMVELVDGQYYVNCNSTSSEAALFQSRDISVTLPLRGEIYEVAKQHIGIPYLLGGTTRRGIDCSALVQRVFRKCGIEMTRTTLTQIAEGIIIPKESLQCGDLVFFKRTVNNGQYVTHVGIYIGNGKMIHAGSKGVCIVNLSSEYYVKHYLCSRRIILTNTPEVENLATAAVATSVAAARSMDNHKWVLTRSAVTE